jgi:MEDS: MEthanogen/methylotroph, DcmR Sensory domain
MNDHAVVLYGTDAEALSRCVVEFIAPGLQDGGAAVVIASTEHERAFRSALAALDIDPASDAVRDRLIFLNAHDTLKAVAVDGTVNSERFERLVGRAIRKLSERYTVHAYSEMVGILRASLRPATAVRLEQLWSRLRAEVPFELFCGYPIDVLGSQFPEDESGLIVTSYSRLISSLTGFDAQSSQAM